MENASKAFLMAASVLIAVLIIYLATRLFSSAAGVVKSYDETMKTSVITSFNANFTKFAGAVLDESDNEKQQYATIYDVISTANFAYDYNAKNFVDPKNPEDPNDPVLIHVNLTTSDNVTGIIKDLQNREDLHYYLVQNCHYANNARPNAKNVISYEIKINSQDANGRINNVTFK